MSIHFCLLLETGKGKDIQLGPLCLFLIFFFGCGVRVIAGQFYSLRGMSDCF